MLFALFFSYPASYLTAMVSTFCPAVLKGDRIAQSQAESIHRRASLSYFRTFHLSLLALLFITGVSAPVLAASNPVSYGFQIYLDNRKISNGIPTGATWNISMSPFTSESSMFDFLASKGFTYSRVMLIMPNVLADGGFANYKAYDKQLFLTHMQMWQSKGIRTILALRDYEYFTVPKRASLLLDMYRTSRQAGLNPVLTLGNEPANRISLPSGYRYTTTEFRQCADLVIPTLQAEYPGTFEWWGSGTADLQDFNAYMTALGPWVPQKRACHTYDGAVVDGSLPMATEVDRSLAHLSLINSAPWIMEEWSPYSKELTINTPEWNTERLRHFKGVMDNNCNLYIFWAANVNPRICTSATELAPWVVSAMAYRPVSTPTPGSSTTPAPTRTKTPTPVVATATAQPTSQPTSTKTPVPPTSTSLPSSTPVATRTPTSQPTSTPTSPGPIQPPRFSYRVNTGGGSCLDTSGDTWMPDQAYVSGSWGYEGGSCYTTSDEIAGTTDDSLYQTERYGLTAYRFDVPNDYYQVTLYFAEIYFGTGERTGIGSRIQNITIEESLVLPNFDILNYVSHDTALQFSWIVNVNDECLDINFESIEENTKVSAIEIVQIDEPTVTPVPPTSSPTNTPVPPTVTRTYTPVPPTQIPTNTPVPPTATKTRTPVPPTATATRTAPQAPTNTPVPPTATRTKTPVPPTATATATLTPVPSTPTPTNTHKEVALTATPTNTHREVAPTATKTSTQPPPTRISTRTPTPPLPTRTIAPTRTPWPTVTKAPTRTPTATRTITPTRTATVPRTYAPTRTPTPTRTVPATRTPTPTRTLYPTRTPRPTRTPVPTRTPIARRTDAPVVYLLNAWGQLTSAEGQMQKSSEQLFMASPDWRALEMDDSGTLYGLLAQGLVVSASDPSVNLGTLFGWDIGREMALVNGGIAILDGFGGIHITNGAPQPGDLPFFTWDIARDIEYASAVKAYYVLTGYGTVSTDAPVMKFDIPYFGWDIAVDLELFPDGNGGYLLDGFGGVTVLGNAPAIMAPYFGSNIARSLGISPDGHGVYILDAYGTIHACGDVDPVQTTPLDAPIAVDFVVR